MHFKDMSIRYKLITLSLFISGIVLLLSSTAFIVNDLQMLDKMMTSNLEIQTQIAGAYTASAVEFDDEEVIKGIFEVLAEDKHIVLAQIYSDSSDEKLTSPIYTYLRADQTAPPPLLGDIAQHQLQYSNAYLQYSLPIQSPNGDEVGTIVLVLDRELIYIRLRIYLTIAVMIILASSIIAVLLSSRLQHIISAPILKLATAMHRISDDKDYNLRVATDTKDEMGILYHGFNEMLSAIQERDTQLEQHRNHLEKIVADRTAELKKLNLKLTYQAYHDALTNLPNRALFIKRTEQAITYAQEHQEMLAMLFIDLDRFKNINDTLGHTAGDRLLQEVAKRLLVCIRHPEDTVARLGGDEFTLLLRDIRDPLNAGIVAERIIKILTTPIYFNQHELYITPSIGISIYPKDGEDVGSLMKNADLGMYTAKKQGRNNYRFFTNSAHTVTAARLNMENKLRQALEYREFEVWYQPRFEIPSGHIVGAEALIRWRSPEFSLVPPAQFIPLAEDTGLIIPIGEWVLKTACQESINWQNQGYTGLHVSVNLSARQFIQEDLLNSIEQLIQQIQIDPHYLELELTESLIMPNAEDTIGTLRALKRLGVQISVDDFGTGYSSLSYLRRFPIDILKIDQSFIADINDQDDDCALVTAIIAMAHNLKLKVVAEGVETQEQLEFLKQHHCDYIQGFLFSKPMPAHDFQQLLKQHFTLRT